MFVPSSGYWHIYPLCPPQQFGMHASLVCTCRVQGWTVGLQPHSHYGTFRTIPSLHTVYFKVLELASLGRYLHCNASLQCTFPGRTQILYRISSFHIWVQSICAIPPPPTCCTYAFQLALPSALLIKWVERVLAGTSTATCHYFSRQNPNHFCIIPIITSSIIIEIRVRST